MAKDHGPTVKDDKRYEGLLKQGMSKLLSGWRGQLQDEPVLGSADEPVNATP